MKTHAEKRSRPKEVNPDVYLFRFRLQAMKTESLVDEYWMQRLARTPSSDPVHILCGVNRFRPKPGDNFLYYVPEELPLEVV